MTDVDPTEALRASRAWHQAVVALRIGYGALGLAALGVLVLTRGLTPWILAAGVLAWLAAALTCAAYFQRARDLGPEPRPGFWAVRTALVHDSVHALPR